MRECGGMHVWDGIFVGDNKKAGKVCKCLCTVHAIGVLPSYTVAAVDTANLSDAHRAAAAAKTVGGVPKPMWVT